MTNDFTKKAEPIRAKLKIRDVRWVNEDEDYGIYVGILMEYDASLKTGYGNTINFKGKIPYPLRKEKVYVIYLEGSPDYNQKYNNYTYTINRFENEQLTLPEEQFEFLATVTPRDIYLQLDEQYRGENIIDLIFEDKIDLTKIKGLKEKSFENLKEKLQLYRDLGKLQSMLRPLGVSISSIKKIAKHFGSPETAHYKLEQNLYNMCEVKGFGFTKVDEIALKGGVDPRDEMRIKFCLGYILEQCGQEGHSYMYRSDMIVQATDYLKIEPSYVINFLDSSEYNKGNKYHFQDVIVVGDMVSTFGMYWDERNTLNHLDRLMDTYQGIERDEEFLNARIDDAQTSLGIIYTEEQRTAVLESLKQGVTVLEGLAGTGKCVKYDTLIPTEKGLIKIEDVPSRFVVNDDDTCEAGIISYDLSGNKINKDTSHFFNMGHSKTIKMKTSQGYYVEGTPEHPVMIINEAGNLEFRKLEDIKGSDVIPISMDNGLFSTDNKVNNNVAYWLGLMVGDGSTNGITYEAKQYQFVLTNGVKTIGQSFCDITKKEFNLDTNVRKERNTDRYTMGNKEFNSYAKEKLDLPICTAPHKYIPSTVMQSTKPVVRKFLQGLFDTDGSFTNRNEFEFSTASQRLANEVHVMLLNFGIVANLREKVVKGYEDRVYYIITIRNPLFVKKFHDEIGFLHEHEKQAKLENFVNNHNFSAYNDNINVLTYMNEKLLDVHKYFSVNLDYYKKSNKYRVQCGDESLSVYSAVMDKRINGRGHRRSVSAQTMKKILEHHPNIPHADYFRNIVNNFFIDYVESVEESEGIVYDFTVPETHSFVSNGIISHNTTVIKGIVEIQKNLGVPCIAVSLSGKASKVLSDKGLEASTIHRLLGYDGSGFVCNEHNPILQKAINLDEGGMVSANIWSSLVQAIPDGAHLVISGDSGQLSAIGAGDIMRDLLASKRYKVISLKQIHRQAKDSGVIEVAHMVREGKNITSYGNEMNQTFGVNKDLQIVTMSKPKKDEVLINSIMTEEQIKEAQNPIYSVAKSVIESKIMEIKYIGDKEQREREILDFQIICPTKTNGALSVDSINSFIQKIYNDNPTGISKGKIEFKKDDKVIISGNKYKLNGYASIDHYIKNQPIEKEYSKSEYVNYSEYDMIEPDQEEDNYEKFDLFNGTVGIVKEVYPTRKTLLIKFEGINALIPIHEDDFDALDLAYAYSIHKSQGSSIPNLLILFDFGAFKLLSKQLVYTALTRTSGKCIMLCENNALHRAIQVDSSGNRRTFMSLFLQHLDSESN